MKKLFYFCIGIFLLLITCFKPEEVAASSEMADVETQTKTHNFSDKKILLPINAKWAENTLIDTDMPQIDYADEDKIIFHAYFGLFVYDLNQSSIIKSIDLKAINCQKVQTGGRPEIYVHNSGNIVFIHPYQSNDMYIYYIGENTLEKLPYQKPENIYKNIISKWEVEESILEASINLCSDNVITFSDGSFGYLTVDNAYITTIKYCKSGKKWNLFNPDNATLQPLLKQDDSFYKAYREYADRSLGMLRHIYSVFYNMGDYAGVCMLSKNIEYTDEEQLKWKNQNLTLRIDEPIEEDGKLYSKCCLVNMDGMEEELTISYVNKDGEWYVEGLPH